MEVDDCNKMRTYVACDDDNLCQTCNYRTRHLDWIVIGACKVNDTIGPMAATRAFVGKGQILMKRHIDRPDSNKLDCRFERGHLWVLKGC